MTSMTMDAKVRPPGVRKVDGQKPHLLNRFIASPSKLYGRDEEFQLLFNTFKESVSSNKNGLVLIRGVSGTGKTALANALQQTVQQHNGFFLTGKFGITGDQEPFAAIVVAFTHWTSLVTGDITRPHDKRLPQIRDALVKAIGEEGKLLTEMIPSLESIIGPQEQTCDVSPIEAVQRLQAVFCRFCNAIASTAPLVLVLDDLQWCDKASLELLDALLSEPASSSMMLVIGTYRDNEVDDIEPSTTTEQAKNQADSQTFSFKGYLDEKKWIDAPPPSLSAFSIHLTNLQMSSLNEMIAGTLHVPLSESTKVAEWLHSKSGGNAFHSLQWLRLLLERNILTAGKGHQTLVFREHETEGLALQQEGSADELIVSQIFQLSEFAQEMLKVSACMGDEIDECTLAILLEGRAEEISTCLKVVVAMGLLTFLPDLGRYRFGHDRFRHAALSIVEDVDNLSFELGYKLWKNASDHFRYTKIFAIASLMIKGYSCEGMTSSRLELAEFYLEAGTKASSLSAFAESYRYLDAGIELLKGGDCWGEHYELTLCLHNSLVDAALCLQKFERIKVLVHDILANARTCMDKVTAYTALINAAGQGGSLQEAVEVGLDVLRQLGVKLPLNPSTFCIIKDIVMTNMTVGGRSDYDILSLPAMQDETKLAAMHILHNLLPYTFQVGCGCMVLIATRLVRLTMKHGMSKLASPGFATYAWVLCRSNRKEGFRFGQLALSIVKNTRAKELIAKVHESVYFFTNHWTRPLVECLAPLQDAYRIGVTVGDIEFAAYAEAFRCTLALYSGMQLSLVEVEYSELVAFMRRYKQKNALNIAAPYLQYLLSLLGRSPDPKLLSGSVFAQKDRAVESKMQLVVCCGLEADLAIRYGDFTLAHELSKKRQASKAENFAVFAYAVDHFNDGLIAASKARLRDRHHRQHVKHLRKMVKEMSTWAVDCPQNFLHKHKILEGELKSLKTSKSADTRVLAIYEEAVKESLSQGFQQEAARASELAGDYLERQKDRRRALELWNQAIQLYADWGAEPQASHLRDRTLRLPIT